LFVGISGSYSLQVKTGFSLSNALAEWNRSSRLSAVMKLSFWFGKVQLF